MSTKAILIDPWERSLETIDIRSGTCTAAMQELYKLIGEDGLDTALIAPGEAIYVGDHSALHNPPLPGYWIANYPDLLYGRGVLIGYHKDGTERDTQLSVDILSASITWYPG